MPELVLLYCPACARESLAEAPPCPDDHGDTCPDRACVECGTALMFDCESVATILLETTFATRRSTSAPRRAA